MGNGKAAGHIVVLNGGSSAGKTTLGRKLQTDLEGWWLLVGIDVLIWTLPEEMTHDPDGIQIVGGEIRRGPGFMRIYGGFQQSVAALAGSGVDVILDDVLIDGVEDQRRWDNVLRGLEVCWVGVHCHPDIAATREVDRGDRPIGIAQHQATRTHIDVRYDLEVDTGVMDLVASLTSIEQDLRNRWSVRSTIASDEMPVLPTPSAWKVDERRRPAPWER